MRRDRIVWPTSLLVIAGALVSAAAGRQPSGQGKSDKLEAKAKTRPSPPPAPAGVTAIRDLDYAGNGHPLQKLDLYVPEDADGPLPLVVHIHGGAWLTGFKEQNIALYLSKRGFAVASIDYRLADSGPFPIMIQDCRAAIRWLRASASRYKIDPERIGVWGSSAGGHLVALLGTAAEQTRWDDGGGHPGVSTRVQAVCDWYGPADILAFETVLDGARADQAINALIGGPAMGKPDVAKQASPVTFVSKDDPPFLIVHGDADTTVPIDNLCILFARLKDAGVDATMIVVKNGKHGGWNANNEPTRSEILDRVASFFETHLNKSHAK